MIVVACPSALKRLSIKALLLNTEAQVVELATEHETLRFCMQHHPKVLILFLDHSSFHSLNIAEEIRAIEPETEILMIVDHVDESVVKEAMHYGLCLTVQDTLTHLQQGIDALLHQKVANASFEPLTRREKEVLALICEGMNNQEIADHLFISLKTVKTHVSNVLAKLGVEDRTKAAVLALKYQLC